MSTREHDDFQRMLLRAGRRQRAPEGLRERSLAAVASVSAAAAVTTTTKALATATATTATNSAAAGGGLLAKALVATRLVALKWMVVASVGVTGGYLAVTHVSGSPPVVVAAPEPVPPSAGSAAPGPALVVDPAPPAEEEPAPPVLELAPPAPRVVAAPSPPVSAPPVTPKPEEAATPSAEEAPAPAPPPAAPKVGLADEIRIIDAARGALAVQNPARTLDLVSEHAQKHVRGALAAERDALRIDALMMEGRTGEASEGARAFVLAYPQSAQRPRMLRIAQQPQFR